MINVRYEVFFSGNVQGVFFRATAKRFADEHEVTGWVRNEPDGRVRCVAECPPDAFELFLAAVQDAKRTNIVSTAIAERKATGEFSGFEIR